PGAATFAFAPPFLGVSRTAPEAAACAAGIPFDLGTTNRPGARFGPSAIRQASRMLLDGEHPLHRVDPCNLALADIGNFAVALGEIGASLAKIESRAAQVVPLFARARAPALPRAALSRS